MTPLVDRTRRPDISFSTDGIIRITARVARILSIRPGDSVSVSLSNGEYLLHSIRPSPYGRSEAACYPSKKGSRNLCAHSVRLCRAILDAAGVTHGRAAFFTGEPVSIAGLTYLPIITRNPITTH